ncbi:hypothetical protein [uncultured Draconibacterium sp.]|uniref:hypothetical protein n=1 Tax=uncultured Draconibacterium sp. TaxID=1573823 RepID=UPI003217FDC7
MKFKAVLFVLLVVVLSCTNKNRFPEKLSTRIISDDLNVPNTETGTMPNTEDFSDLQHFVNQYNAHYEQFNLNNFENLWSQFQKGRILSKWNVSEKIQWAEITGLLLELTNNTVYAEELENCKFHSDNSLDGTINPFVFTKRVDHIYVNLFQNKEINYTHTLGGEVTFSQETDFPESGSVKFHFGMTERRYIELYIRIPSWADGSTVTVKKVKYFAAPGSYCLIAKKWKEGDLVEVEFPAGKIPNY